MTTTQPADRWGEPTRQVAWNLPAATVDRLRSESLASRRSQKSIVVEALEAYLDTCARDH